MFSFLSAKDCKAKWNSLRSSYARYLRDERKVPSGSGASKKKKWYLADSMSFMHNFIGQNKKTASDVVVDDNSEIEVKEEARQTIFDEDMGSQSIAASFDSLPRTSTPTRITKAKRHKIMSAAEAVPGPTIEYVTTRIHNQNDVSSSANFKFLESLVGDVDSLAPRRQRYFKEKVLSILHNLMDEQEQDHSRSNSTTSH